MKHVRYAKKFALSFTTLVVVGIRFPKHRAQSAPYYTQPARRCINYLPSDLI